MPDYKYEDKTSIYEVDDISEIKTGINMVLVKPLFDTSVLPSGLYIDTDWQEVNCAPRVVEVVKIPTTLAIKGINSCNEQNFRALDWCTKMELHKGDKAWVDPLYVILNNNTAETHVFNCKGQLYYLIKYDKFIVAKRGDEVICLNGYILIEESFREGGLSDYQNEVLEKEGTVAYTGSKNEFYYRRPTYSDNIDIQPGYKVLCPVHRIYLEDELYACFDGKKKFIVTQRKNILYSYKPDDMSIESKKLLPGKLWVKRDEAVTETEAGIILPEVAQKERKTGKVVNMGDLRQGEESIKIKPGTTVSFAGVGVPIEVEGEELLVFDVQSIDWYE